MYVFGLVTGNLCTNGFHIEFLDLGDQALKRGLWECSWLREHLDSVAESHDCRNRLDAEAPGEGLFGLGVDLGEGDVFVLF